MKSLPFCLALSLGSFAHVVSAAFSFCGLVMNDTNREFAFAKVDNETGITSRELELPMLDEFGLGVSAGTTKQGLYYTISGTAKEQEEVLVVDVPAGKAGYVQVELPKEFSFLSLYGIAMLDVDETKSSLLAMVMGYASLGERYCFLGDLDPRDGKVTRIVYNLTLAYRQWEYLYSGVSAWDPHNSLYYLEAVEGAQDRTSLYVFNTSDDSQGASPLLSLRAPTEGMFLALGISPALGLIALVDDDLNTAAALWQLHVPHGEWDKAHWKSLYQYKVDKLTGDGNNDFLLSDNGEVAYSVFYDDHQPIANQVISSVNLRLGREVGRTIVVGSQNGTASVADLAHCPHK